MNVQVNSPKSPRVIIARLSIGAETVADGIGSLCIADRGDGFEVFINGGVLPSGQDSGYFPASSLSSLEDAYAFAFRVARRLASQQVEA